VIGLGSAPSLKHAESGTGQTQKMICLTPSIIYIYNHRESISQQIGLSFLWPAMTSSFSWIK